MANFNFIDFYIKYPGHPNYTSYKFIEDDTVRVILQKYEMILFTNKGELLGDPNFGCDLTKLLYETKISAEAVKSTIIVQINTYISELQGTNYTLEVTFQQDPENYQDVMIVDFTLSDYEVKAIVS